MTEKSLKKEDLEIALNGMVADGTLFASCPTCKQHLNYNEYCLRRCNQCKKIKFEDITYINGAIKDNN